VFEDRRDRRLGEHRGGLAGAHLLDALRELLVLGALRCPGLPRGRGPPSITPANRPGALASAFRMVPVPMEIPAAWTGSAGEKWLAPPKRPGRMHLVCYLRDGEKVFETYWTTMR